jgi:hypothetical protein
MGISPAGRGSVQPFKTEKVHFFLHHVALSGQARGKQSPRSTVWKRAVDGAEQPRAMGNGHGIRDPNMPPGVCLRMQSMVDQYGTPCKGTAGS